MMTPIKETADADQPVMTFTGERGFPRAITTVSGGQKIILLVLISGFIYCLWQDHYRTLLFLNAGAAVFYITSMVYRSLLIDISLKKNRDIVISPSELAEMDKENAWARYIILIPLYHEGDILPHLVDALSKLDYPSDKLEIRLLIEEDDDETMQVAHDLGLSAPFVILPVPVSYPRTKPKACNYGLEDADADYLVIYDAEDRPDTDQLKKAAAAFRKVPKNVACIQAKLNFYNPYQNFLTKCFTAEYATWFDLCLPGLDFFHAPLPLGGTSNHFRLDILKSVGGWDEYNVTEDCDLGLRLFARGWRTSILDSTTWEQACPHLGNWIRQRSRWIKGYIQTYCVHLRNPVKSAFGLGIFNGIHYHLVIGGTPLSQLINPIYWGLAVFWLITRSSSLSIYFPTPIFAMASVCLFVGNFLFAYTSSIACVRRGRGDLAIYGLVIPFYWILMSIGAWKGFLQLIRKPHFWEKTKHFKNSG
ncbi:MAG: glycosyltransferase family 2 protein [Lentisphaeria bacterium]